MDVPRGTYGRWLDLGVFPEAKLNRAATNLVFFIFGGVGRRDIPITMRWSGASPQVSCGLSAHKHRDGSGWARGVVKNISAVLAVALG
jgi:hypothetical protein